FPPNAPPPKPSTRLAASVFPKRNRRPRCREPAAKSHVAPSRARRRSCERWPALVNARAGVVFQLRDFILHMQLAALEVGDGEVVDGRMRQSVIEFLFERLMLPFQFRKMRLDGH